MLDGGLDHGQVSVLLVKHLRLLQDCLDHFPISGQSLAQFLAGLASLLLVFLRLLLVFLAGAFLTGPIGVDNLSSSFA